jgi:hydroxyacylglutathione hydrolase
MPRFPLRTAAALLLGALAACTLNLRQVQDPPRSAAVATAYPWNSMVYVASTDSGVVVVDLGWYGAERALRRGLRRVGAAPEEVTGVFLTHSHRDHIAGWRAVRHARFHVAAAEVALLEGGAHHPDLPSRAGERLAGNPAPWHGEVEVSPFARDTAFVLGRDTLRAFLVPGHTAGSAAYLFRGVLFVGDAVAYSYLSGFRPAFGIFTDDPERGRASLAALWERVRPYAPRWVCTAHAKCAPADSAFARKVIR